MDFNKLALEEAGKSLCRKRKVGAIIANESKTKILAKGHNYVTHGHDCEDLNGDTRPEVVHAEIAAINKINNFKTLSGCDRNTSEILRYFVKNKIFLVNPQEINFGKIPASCHYLGVKLIDKNGIVGSILLSFCMNNTGGITEGGEEVKSYSTIEYSKPLGDPL